jgi:hypothetical protein
MSNANVSTGSMVLGLRRGLKSSFRRCEVSWVQEQEDLLLLSFDKSYIACWYEQRCIPEAECYLVSMPTCTFCLVPYPAAVSLSLKYLGMTK